MTISWPDWQQSKNVRVHLAQQTVVGQILYCVIYAIDIKFNDAV